jgi:DNA-binding MarR family transcriptional regulator
MSGKSKQQLFFELTRAIRENQAANQKLDHAVFKSLGINATDGRCFDILDQHGPMSAGHLASSAGLTTGAVTQVIDRLEKKGFVERLGDPEDRRRVVLAITDEGRRVAGELYAPLARKGAEEFSYLTNAEIDVLIEFHRRSTALQEETAETILGDLEEGRP